MESRWQHPVPQPARVTFSPRVFGQQCQLMEAGRKRPGAGVLSRGLRAGGPCVSHLCCAVIWNVRFS